MSWLTGVLPRGFRARLTLLFGGLAFMIGLPAYFYVEYVYSRQLVMDRSDELHHLAISVSAVLSENLAERQREIDLLAQSPLFRSKFYVEEYASSFGRLQKSYPYYSWLGFATPQGNVEAAVSGMLVGSSVKARPWFIHGQHGSFSGDLHNAVLLAKVLPKDASGQLPRFIDFASPVYDLQGRLRGVIAAHAHWRWATGIVKVLEPKNAAQQKLDIMIVNSNNEVIYPGSVDNKPVYLPAGMKKSVDGTMLLNNWGTETDYIAAIAPVKVGAAAGGIDWRIVVRQPVSIALQKLRGLQHTLLLFGLLAAAVFAILAYWMAVWVSRPVEALAREARGVSSKNDTPTFNVPDNSSKEVRYLAAALRHMMSAFIKSKEALARNNEQLERKVSERTAALAEANRHLFQLARTDGLTGLLNRLAANETLASLFQCFKLDGCVYAVLLMDIDHFKSINDRYGHPVGDLVLQKVAEVLASSVRQTDVLARFGGEEFLVLLPDTTLQAALMVAEKVRQTLEQAALDEVGKVTISIGVTVSLADDRTESDVLKRADSGLYSAKRLGRNRVVAN